MAQRLSAAAAGTASIFMSESCKPPPHLAFALSEGTAHPFEPPRRTTRSTGSASAPAHQIAVKREPGLPDLVKKKDCAICYDSCFGEAHDKVLACENCSAVSRMHAACHAAWVAKGGHGGCIQQCGGQLRQYAPPPRPSESEIEVCSDGDGAHDDESAEEGAKDEREDREDGSYAGECTNDEAHDDAAKPAAKRKRKANKGSGRPAKPARAQTPNGNKCRTAGEGTCARSAGAQAYARTAGRGAGARSAGRTSPLPCNMGG